MILAKTVTGFSDFITEHRPDLIVVHGDRIEALAGALVCRHELHPLGPCRGRRGVGHDRRGVPPLQHQAFHHHFVSSEAAARRVRRWANRERRSM
jgi:UDP-N-acetylglucosamine 2-epimerase (hydrolysing)